MLEFQELMSLPQLEVGGQKEEARFSFLHGGYVEDFDLQGILSFYFRFAFCTHLI